MHHAKRKRKLRLSGRRSLLQKRSERISQTSLFAQSYYYFFYPSRCEQTPLCTALLTGVYFFCWRQPFGLDPDFNSRWSSKDEEKKNGLETKSIACCHQARVRQSFRFFYSWSQQCRRQSLQLALKNGPAIFPKPAPQAFLQGRLINCWDNGNEVAVSSIKKQHFF